MPMIWLKPILFGTAQSMTERASEADWPMSATLPRLGINETGEAFNPSAGRTMP